MISLHFSGWAQCRLATDPDPFDERRGVSGYMRAYAGEPDLDRIIRFQDPPFSRTLTPEISVKITEVANEGGKIAEHPLIGARVELLGGSKFEGRNGAIAEDATEPIYPFHLQVRAGDEFFGRATVPSDPTSPYREFNASAAYDDKGELISNSTGIPSLIELWKDRRSTLAKEMASAGPDDRPALEERIAFLDLGIARPPDEGAAGFFWYLMEWNYLLKSKPDFSSGANELVGQDLDAPAPWLASFWFAGWDADAQAFYVSGQLEIGGDAKLPEKKDATARTIMRRPERMSDIGSPD